MCTEFEHDDVTLCLSEFASVKKIPPGRVVQSIGDRSACPTRFEACVLNE